MFIAKFAALSILVAAVSAQVPKVSNPVTLQAGLGDRICLTAEGLDNGATVDVQSCQNRENQLWSFTNGQVTIFNGTKCLDVKDGVNADWTIVQLWDCTKEDNNQQWYYTVDNRRVPSLLEKPYS